MKTKLLTILIFGLLIFSGSINTSADVYVLPKQSTSMPNVIYLIGDGMGPEQIRAASLVEYGAEFATIMDTDFPSQSTYTVNDINSLDITDPTKDVTDSAAAGTALATGRLTKRGRVSMDDSAKIRFKTILEYLGKDFNYRTGLVTTTEIAHATPAVFGAHTKDRDDKDRILNQQLSQGLTVFMGGGLDVSYIGSESAARDLGVQNDMDVAINRDELLSLNGTSDRILGIFPRFNMPFELERDIVAVPSLREMANVAINTLDSEEKPFFVMIEGGRIDHAGHENHFTDDNAFNNKTAKNVLETIMFEKTVRETLKFAKNDGNTIVIVTADHETGGLHVLDFTNLDDTLPNDANDYETNREIRTKRALQLNVSWGSTGHTNSPIRFFGYGGDFSQYQINHIEDVFWSTISALGSFPIVYHEDGFANDGEYFVEYKIRDLDESAESIKISLDLFEGGELISSDSLTPSIAFSNTFFNYSTKVDLLEGQTIRFKATITDSDDRATSSLGEALTYSAPTDTGKSENGDSNFLLTPFLVTMIPVLIMSRKKIK